MKSLKVIALSAALVAAGLSAPASAADLTGNIGVTSNYVWRGLTQTNNGAAVSGGLDYSMKSGLYLGTWVSNTAFGTPTSQEHDLYVGFGMKTGPVELDFGGIQYRYSQDDTLDWTEFYVGATYKDFGAQINISSDVFGSGTDGMYIEASYDYEIKKGLTLGLHFGSYDFDDEAAAAIENYTDFSVGLSKGDFSFVISDTSLNSGFAADTDLKFTVSWGKEFSL